MAKIQIKSEKLTPFGGIFSIMEQFDALLALVLRKEDKQNSNMTWQRYK